MTCKKRQLCHNRSNYMDIKTKSHTTTMRDRPLIFLDLEATGLEIQKSEIIEIGAVKTEQKYPFEVLGEFHVKVKPQHLETADPEGLKVAGFIPAEWEEALDLKEALKQLDKFSEEGVLVGYNTPFDWALLDKSYFSLGRQDPFYYHRLDVMNLAYYKLYKEKSIQRFSLGNICRYLKIPVENQHRALGDAKMTYTIYKKLFRMHV